MPFTLVWTPSFTRTARKFLAKHRDLKGTFSLILHKLEANPQDPELRLHPFREGFLANTPFLSPIHTASSFVLS